jgi:hypothetical protein
MLDTIRRFLFEGAKPIDRTMLCIELAVLLVIIYAEVRSHLREKRLALREKLITDRRRDLSEFVTRGLKLQGTVTVGVGWTAVETGNRTAWQSGLVVETVPEGSRGGCRPRLMR